MKDVYIVQQRITNLVLGGRTAIPAHVEQLRTEGFVWSVQADQHGQVTRLFFTYRPSSALFGNYPKFYSSTALTRQIGTTCRSADGVGIMGVNTSFIVAMAF
jgi:hypothetical protein